MVKSLSQADVAELFIGEGKKDTACIKFREHRCRKGANCLYRHDLRDVLSKNVFKDNFSLQSLSLTNDPPATTTFVRRMQAASPSRGSSQLAAFLDAIDRSLPFETSLETLELAPAFIHLLDTAPILPLVISSQLGIPVPLAASSVLKALSLAINRTRPTPLPTTRLVRSAPPINIAGFDGFCTQGHRIFKRTPIRPGTRHTCSFCRTEHQTDIFTCFCGASHSCLPCLTSRNTAPPPPQCYASSCPGVCAIEAVTKASTCWNGGHDVKKGTNVWRCGSCKFIVCRSCLCILKQKTFPSDPHSLSLKVETSDPLTASSAIASASMPQ
jgi:hypothetical protein